MNFTCGVPTKNGSACRKKVPFQDMKCYYHRGETVGQCSICLETINTSEKITLACYHTFHDRCIHKWLSMKNKECKECPNCRAVVRDNKTLSWIEDFRQKEKDEDWLPDKEIRVPRRRRRARRLRTRPSPERSFLASVYDRLTSYLSWRLNDKNTIIFFWTSPESNAAHTPPRSARTCPW
jgi:hypothetical protein